MARKCGECLMNDVEIVELDETGVCPACGTDYGPDIDEAAEAVDDIATDPVPES